MTQRPARHITFVGLRYSAPQSKTTEKNRSQGNENNEKLALNRFFIPYLTLGNDWYVEMDLRRARLERKQGALDKVTCSSKGSPYSKDPLESTDIKT
ncbi:hypothetical protein NDU88_004639 [Pleurodeles waltl]|uniref:Uncharacterized protein n=1 Tax=Pleurodeles waltl TaxID=8319 RepID=A0AAV7T8H5_PLEWA|nr:hypothetical protein NDU88_004639 [Pleurodeles waltl]